MSNILALVAATAVLVLIPGPNVALIVGVSLGQGFRAGLVTAFGTTVGLAVQLLLVAGGLAAVIGVVASALAWIKWLGVAYLLYLGVRTWRAQSVDPAATPAGRNGNFLRAILFAVVNPKTLLFNAAFLPQFVSNEAGAGELFVVTGVYLTVIVVGDACWALFAAAARRRLGRFARFSNRLTGAFMVGGGLGLALSRQSG